MTQKMQGKPSTAGALSLDAFIQGADPVVQAQDAPMQPAKRGRGKPPKAPENVRSEKIQIQVTERELKKLKQAAGHIPLSTFLRVQLQEKGLI